MKKIILLLLTLIFSIAPGATSIGIASSSYLADKSVYIASSSYVADLSVYIASSSYVADADSIDGEEFMHWMKREKKMVSDFRDVCVAKEIPHEFQNFM